MASSSQPVGDIVAQIAAIDDSIVIPANITKELAEHTKKKAILIYVIALGFWIFMWMVIRKYLNLSFGAWLVFYYGLFYFSFLAYTVGNNEVIQVQGDELDKIKVLEEYSRTIAELALGVAIFVSIHRGTDSFIEMRRTIVLPIAGFVFIVLGPLSFFWVPGGSQDLYIIRHFKAILYMMGIFLIVAFMIDMIFRIYFSGSHGYPDEETVGFDILGIINDEK